MPIRLHNTLSRGIEAFQPLNAQRVTLYACGPTVYGYVHIGNARPAVICDVLVNLLRRHFPTVLYARNITDVDDKINAAAAAAGVPIGDIAERYTRAYHEDMADLGVALPDVEPSATAHIDAIVAMCRRLIDSGHAYAADGHVLFDVGSFPEYGALSGRSVEDMIAGARVEVATYKRDPADFVLWKPSSEDLPGWNSPWGRGRPGWHIECSAMSAAHLGETIDIHVGGNDLIFPHHENEIAQSTCAHDGAPLARYWLHCGMLTMHGRKMSKSLGNTVLLHELLQQHPPEALRLLLLKAHYRQPLDWSEEALAQAVRTLDGWYGVLRDLTEIPAQPRLPERIETALCDDLNTPRALAELAALADAARHADAPAERGHAKSALLGAGAVLGLLQQAPEAWFKRAAATEGGIDAETVDALVDARQRAREQRDWSRADAIRDELAALGVAIEDGPQGTRWKTIAE